jgi:hypothetical protein
VADDAKHCAHRGEKKILNEINNHKVEGGPKYRVPDATRPDRPRERISTAEEKIYIMVCARGPHDGYDCAEPAGSVVCSALGCDAGVACDHLCKAEPGVLSRVHKTISPFAPCIQDATIWFLQSAPQKQLHLIPDAIAR